MKAMISAMAMAMVVVGGSAALAAEPTAQEPTAQETAQESGATQDPNGPSVGTGAEAYCYWETYCNVYGYCWTNWVCF